MYQTEQEHWVTGLDPVADAFSGTVNSDVVSLLEYNNVEFIAWWGVGATGTITLTVEACDDVVPTTTSAVPFRSRRYTSADTAVAAVNRAAAGFTTTAGSTQRYICEIRADALLASGYRYARLHSVESVDSPILGGILIRLSEPRYAIATPGTAVA